MLGSKRFPREMVISRTPYWWREKKAQENLGLVSEPLVKIWPTVGDGKTRASHIAAHGQARLMGERFTVGNALLMTPRDPNGPIGEVINCRCQAMIFPLSQLPTEFLPQIEGRLTDEQKKFLRPPPFFSEEVRRPPRENQDIPIINMEENRIKSIIDNTRSIFEISENPNADDSKAFHEWHDQHEVTENEEFIIKEAKAQDVDPDLIRAIIYMETSRGWYDKFLLGLNNSVRPMNVGAEEWQDLGVTRRELDDPETNIRIGVTILKRIEERIENPTIAKIASIYQFTGNELVSDYGARVAKIYELKLWEKPKLNQPLSRVP